MAWTLALLGVVVGSLLGPVLFVPALLAAIGFAVRAAVLQPGRAWMVVMLSAATLWVACSVALFWLWGVGFDAADAMLPAPPVTRWFAPSFWVGFAAFIAFWAAFAASLLSRSRSRSSG